MNARDLLGRAKTRTAALAGTAALLAGGLGASILLPAGAADAAACTGTSLAAGTSCTLTGTATVTAGTLAMASMPSALGWSVTMNGLDSKLVDTVPGHTSLQVNDNTGSGAGWNITVSATTFTTGTKTLANTGTLSLTGSTTNQTVTTAPERGLRHRYLHGADQHHGLPGGRHHRGLLARRVQDLRHLGQHRHGRHHHRLQQPHRLVAQRARQRLRRHLHLHDHLAADLRPLTTIPHPHHRPGPRISP